MTTRCQANWALLLFLPTLALSTETTAAGANLVDVNRQGSYPWNCQGVLARLPRASLMGGACATTTPTPRVLLAGDSRAQYMRDDDAHNVIFDKFGMADHLAVSRSLGSNPVSGWDMSVRRFVSPHAGITRRVRARSNP